MNVFHAFPKNPEFSTIRSQNVKDRKRNESGNFSLGKHLKLSKHFDTLKKKKASRFSYLGATRIINQKILRMTQAKCGSLESETNSCYCSRG